MKLPFLKKKSATQEPAAAPRQTAAAATLYAALHSQEPEPAAHEMPAVQAFLQKHGQTPEQFDLQQVTDAFLADMRAGLRGEGGLPMLPAYFTVDTVVPQDRPVTVIDMGGTHLRAARVVFHDRLPLVSDFYDAPMPGARAPVTWDDFIRTAADALEPLLDGAAAVGVCYSYIAEITPALDARILPLTKEVRITGAEGRLLCAALSAELAARGKTGLRFVTINDTPAAYVRGKTAISSNYTNGFLGMVVGTGTNLCCELPVRRIEKLGRPDDDTPMLVNLESGAFTGVPQGDFDRALDAASEAPGTFLLEKMTGGRYLGELCRLTLDAAAREGLFSSAGAACIAKLETLSAKDADGFAAGPERAAGTPLAALAGNDRDAAVQIITALFRRAARALTAGVAAVLALTGGADSRYRPLVVCVDGSLFAGSLLLRSAMAETMQAFLGQARRQYAVCKPVDRATIIGTAAAALQILEQE